MSEGSSNIKDLVGSEDAYQKSNSFSDFVLAPEKFEKVRGKLQAALERLDSNIGELSEDDALAKKAASCLLGKEKADGDVDFSLTPNVAGDLSRISDQDYDRYLRYRYRYEVYPVIRKLDEFPPCVQIEPTSMCNLRCVFCYQTDSRLTHRKEGHMGRMPLERFKTLIDQLEGKCEAVTLASRGEPTLCKDLPEMLKYMSGKFLAAKVNTNATKLTEDLCHALLSTEGLTVVFSADAAEEPLYSQLRVNSDLETVLKNIGMFNDIRTKHYKNSNILTRVSGVRVNSQQNIDDMTKVWGDMVDQIAFVDYNPWENSYDRDPVGEDRPCSDLWRRMFVWWDGKVNPCDVDYRSHLQVGNVDNGGIGALWHSEDYDRLRNNHLEGSRGKVSPCNRCTFI